LQQQDRDREQGGERHRRAHQLAGRQSAGLQHQDLAVGPEAAEGDEDPE
jgi:hypothetical protein